jgi:Protein of unknown function (DUF2975)
MVEIALRLPEKGPLGRLSTLMCGVIVLGAVLSEIALCWIWLSPDLVKAWVAPRLLLADVPVDLSISARLWSFAICMVPMGVLLYMLRQAFLLFEAYRTGRIFAADAPVRLRRIGWCLAAIGLLRVAVVAAVGLVLTAANPPGQRILAIAVSLDDYMIAAFGGLILAIGQVMVEANRLADDYQQIV